jgi:hypothetical protein
MPASERLWLGEPCAHVAEFYERMRLRNLARGKAVSA